MPLLHEPVRRLHRIDHPLARHDDTDAAAGEPRGAQGRDGRERGRGRGGRGRGEDAERVEFGEEVGGVGVPEWGGGGEEGEEVG